MADKKKSAKKPIYESQESLYEKAVQRMEMDSLIVQFAYKAENYRIAADMFEEIGDYQDSAEKARLCRELAERTEAEEREHRYQKALKQEGTCKSNRDYEKLAEIFRELGDYRDAAKRAEECRDKIAANRGQKRKKRSISGIVAAACVVLVIVGISSGFFRYLLGRGYEMAGKNANARQTFEGLGSFLDSEERAERLSVLAQTEKEKAERKALLNAKKGDDVAFGKFTWKVLERDKDHLFLMVSVVNKDSGLTQIPFHDAQEDVDWEHSSLRAWLNSEILETCFTEEERDSLVLMDVEGEDNETYGTSGGASTQDYVSILSMEEAEEYQKNLKSLGLDYWLRAPGNRQDTAAYMSAAHLIMDYGYPVSSDMLSVRPVITVDRSVLKGEKQS